jgi:putative tricarboxylic transport membrane protein
MDAKQIRKFEGFLWVGVGVVICLLSWQSQLGSFREPGPGFIGFFAGSFITCIGFVMLFSSFFSKASRLSHADSDSAFSLSAWPRFIYTVGLLLAYSLLLNPLGYIVTTFLVMWGLFYDREKGRLISGLVASFITVGVTYLIFEVWLHCQFPTGVLPWR